MSTERLSRRTPNGERRLFFDNYAYQKLSNICFPSGTSVWDPRRVPAVVLYKTDDIEQLIHTAEVDSAEGVPMLSPALWSVVTYLAFPQWSNT